MLSVVFVSGYFSLCFNFDDLLCVQSTVQIIFAFSHAYAGYGKTVCHVVIGMKTAKGTKSLKLDPSIYESLQKEKVETGDVIYIEANSGAVKVSVMGGGGGGWTNWRNIW